MQKPDEDAPPVVGEAFDWFVAVAKWENLLRAHSIHCGRAIDANRMDLLTPLVEAAFASLRDELLQTDLRIRMDNDPLYRFRRTCYHGLRAFSLLRSPSR
jgi:hypothetical protein